tara:strand:+ start:1147 stop:1371 length:225 start_codon:yes stop_codon:yes gene_type:complete
MNENSHSFVKNSQSLRWRLAQVFNDLENGTLKAGEAKEFANIAGKMINSSKAQLEYYALRGEEPPKMEFLEEVE